MTYKQFKVRYEYEQKLSEVIDFAFKNEIGSAKLMAEIYSEITISDVHRKSPSTTKDAYENYKKKLNETT